MKNLLTASMFLVFAGSLFVAPAKAQSVSNNQTSSATTLEGVVQSVTGSRITIKRNDGQIQTVTTTSNVSEALIGKTITGNVKPAGDTLLINDFVTKN